ncbi:hypothetical protein RclHR1_07390004 [Rhizophagus clarus]|nr:hypothetical protein RclHR1_07390004 [Rhizophagus clarus]
MPLSDALAKQGCTLAPIWINPRCLPDSLLSITHNFSGPLDKNIRKWFKTTLNCYTSLSALRNKPMSHLSNLSKRFPVDWNSTSLWMKSNNDNTTCGELNDKITSFKIKNLSHTLPTSDIQIRNYPL